MALQRILQEYVEVRTDRDVIFHVGRQRGNFAVMLGAGASAEAGVPLADQICTDIRSELIRSLRPSNEEEWARTELRWEDPIRRYGTCLRRYGNPTERVEYFRKLLKGKEPVFSHHAMAQLMARRFLKATCFTTNFDTLVELAFSSQGNGSCQAIRIKEEADFWGTEEDRSYILKLHGDYDTHNVLNTRDETTNVDPYHVAIASQVLTNAGLITLGLAGNEESVQNLFQNLLFSPGGKGGRRGGPLTLGLYWGVYVGSERPNTLDPDWVTNSVKERIEKGAVNQKIVEIVARANKEKMTCAFFPVWGSGNFLYDLISEFRDTALLKTSELYLDHQTRLRATFTKQGLTKEAIQAHLQNLQRQEEALAVRAPIPAGKPEPVDSVSHTEAQIEVRILYGDITSRSMMGEKAVEGLRRAVVSPDDTAMSAGGGVALALLKKAGPPIILNEISKLSPIDHCDVAVTSGGRLPVQYILHAAALRIETDGAYTVSPRDVETTMHRLLELVASLRIQVLWVPLLAAGSASVKAEDSFDAILRAIAAWSGQGVPTTICIVIFREAELGRDRIAVSLSEKFPHAKKTE